MSREKLNLFKSLSKLQSCRNQFLKLQTSTLIFPVVILYQYIQFIKYILQLKHKVVDF